MVHSQATDDVDLGGVIPIALLVVVHGLELVLFLLVEVAHLCEDFRVTWHLRDQNVVPLESLPAHADQFIHMGYLIDDLVAIGDDSVQFLERLQRLIIVSKALVHQT